jgi:hypothetical protein
MSINQATHLGTEDASTSTTDSYGLGVPQVAEMKRLFTLALEEYLFKCNTKMLPKYRHDIIINCVKASKGQNISLKKDLQRKYVQYYANVAEYDTFNIAGKAIQFYYANTTKMILL